MKFLRINQHIYGKQSYRHNYEGDPEEDAENDILRDVAILLQLHPVRLGYIAVLIH
jgi:hypothetical protein